MGCQSSKFPCRAAPALLRIAREDLAIDGSNQARDFSLIFELNEDCQDGRLRITSCMSR
jgi:hypothetical protein